MSDQQRQYHIGFGRDDLTAAVGTTPTLVLLSGDPARTRMIATTHLQDAHLLSDHRGLDSFVARLPSGAPVICATSGMGGPSTSIVLNELAQVGVRTVIRIGTTGSIQPHVRIGSVIISSAALSRHGAALDVAPREFPAVADPFLVVGLAAAATRLGIVHHVGITASVDTFFEGQERTASSVNPTLLRRLQGITEEYRALGVLNYEMESATVFVLSSVYAMAAGCVCAVVAERTESESVDLDEKDAAIERAVQVAIAGAEAWLARSDPGEPA